MYSQSWSLVAKSTNRFGLRSFRRLLTTSNHDQCYQYIERSDERTDRYQPQLPILPIPELEDTCKRYLDYARPLIYDGNQMSNTENNVNDFKNQIGRQLDHQLRVQNEKNINTHYFHDFFNETFLANRVPLLINVNPYMILEENPDLPKCISIRATTFLISLLRYRRSLVDNVLEPEKIEMRPFKNLFSTTRMPREDKDTIEYFGPNQKHVIFLRKGQFFKFNVLDQNGDIKPPQDIYNFICNLREYDLDSLAVDTSITTLSTLDRDRWSVVRNQLENLTERNRKNMEAIDSALFILNLDDEEFDTNNLDARSLGFLHGTYKPEDVNNENDIKHMNRWFDKSIQLIISRNGDAGLNFEHSWGEGVIILNVLNKIFTDSSKVYQNYLANLRNESNKYNISAFKLQFDLDDSLKNSVDSSKEHYKKLISPLKMSVVSYGNMDRDYLKTKNISPDFVFQLAIQLANYKLFTKMAPTYEACSTARFKMGRTEIIRSATMEAKLACKALAWGEKKFTFSDLREALSASSEKHQELSKLAAIGQGCDRHLFAMKCLAKELDMSTPAIFTDPTYAFFNHFTLFTSHLFSDNVCSGGYGPVVDDGFGLAYGFTDKGLTLNCTSLEAHEADQFSDAFLESCQEINNVLERSTKLKPQAKEAC